MPRGTGSGSTNAGTGMGSGKGRCGGGRGGSRSGGPGGECICLSCGATAIHQAGTPCYQVKCPKCGVSMARK
ncbi:MAG: hypothetical protein WA126_12475 [Thermodesulfovibrionales bacterium]